VRPERKGMYKRYQRREINFIICLVFLMFHILRESSLSKILEFACIAIILTPVLGGQCLIFCKNANNKLHYQPLISFCHSQKLFMHFYDYS
jgi:hypothetical protein